MHELWTQFDEDLVYFSKTVKYTLLLWVTHSFVIGLKELQNRQTIFSFSRRLFSPSEVLQTPGNFRAEQNLHIYLNIQYSNSQLAVYIIKMATFPRTTGRTLVVNIDGSLTKSEKKNIIKQLKVRGVTTSQPDKLLLIAKSINSRTTMEQLRNESHS